MVITALPSATGFTTIPPLPTSIAGDSGHILVRFSRGRYARQVCPKALAQLLPSSDMTRLSSDESG
jgi:hypothetical protein